MMFEGKKYMKVKNICLICKTEHTHIVRCPKCGNFITGAQDSVGYKRNIKIVKATYWRRASVISRNVNYGIRNNKSINITLVVPEIIDRRTLFTSLHELGHIANNHHNYKRGSTSRRITVEVEAWLYALRCIKPLYKVEMIGVAMECIKTYIPCRYYNEYNFGLINAILRAEITITKKIKFIKGR